MHRALLLASSAALFCSCQPSEKPLPPDDLLAPFIESRNIVARNYKPDVMLVVDGSAGMGAPLDPEDPACPVGCGAGAAACPDGCPTRLSELTQGLIAGLTANPIPARLGLIAFPVDEPCTAANSNVLVGISHSRDVDSELLATVGDIKTQLSRLQPAGLSSATDALRLINQAPPFDDRYRRQSFVMLVTGTVPGPGCHRSKAAEAVLALARNGLKTIVVGVGPAADSREGSAAFNAMAELGGFARVCPRQLDSECGANNTCNVETRVCNQQFYSAATAAELAATWTSIADVQIDGNPCVYQLSHRSTVLRQLQVSFDGVPVATDEPGGGWDYADGAVTFKGSRCAQIKDTFPDTPIKLEFKINWTL